MGTKTSKSEEKKTTGRKAVVLEKQSHAIVAGSKLSGAVVVHSRSGGASWSIHGEGSGGSAVVKRDREGFSDEEIAADRQRMLQLLERARASAIAEGLPLLDLDGIEEEVASRRGGIY